MPANSPISFAGRISVGQPLPFTAHHFSYHHPFLRSVTLVIILVITYIESLPLGFQRLAAFFLISKTFVAQAYDSKGLTLSVPTGTKAAH